MQENEQVNHPKHYGGEGSYECIKVLQNWLTSEQFNGFLLGNALKYICRLDKKDDSVKDAQKAIWYLQKYVQTKTNG